ncbi:MAG: TetR family transcriptional regulator [Rhodospirillales bacterium]|nr:TetR family transcriptional regulator [Rhodospirillales bacterium]
MPKTQDRTPKSERTRAAILDAARATFAELGYDRATVRDIAARASIDPAMVIRYFGSKDGLFARATAFDLKLPDLSRVSPGRRGQALVAHFLDVWEGDAGGGGMTILLRAAATDPEAADRMREIFASQVAPAMLPGAGRAEVARRAGLVATQMLGLAFCRYVLRLPPVVAMTREEIIGSVGPTVQRYLG